MNKIQALIERQLGSLPNWIHVDTSKHSMEITYDANKKETQYRKVLEQLIECGLFSDRLDYYMDTGPLIKTIESALNMSWSDILKEMEG